MKKRLLLALIFTPLLCVGAGESTASDVGIFIKHASVNRVFSDEQHFDSFRQIAFEPDRVFSEDYEAEELKQVAFDHPTLSTDETMIRIADELIAENAQPINTPGEDINPKAFDKEFDDTPEPPPQSKAASDIQFVSERD